MNMLHCLYTPATFNAVIYIRHQCIYRMHHHSVLSGILWFFVIKWAYFMFAIILTHSLWATCHVNIWLSLKQSHSQKHMEYIKFFSGHGVFLISDGCNWHIRQQNLTAEVKSINVSPRCCYHLPPLDVRIYPLMAQSAKAPKRHCSTHVKMSISLLCVKMTRGK